MEQICQKKKANKQKKANQVKCLRYCLSTEQYNGHKLGEEVDVVQESRVKKGVYETGGFTWDWS